MKIIYCREAARRVRRRKQAQLEALTHELDSLATQNRQLLARFRSARASVRHLC